MASIQHNDPANVDAADGEELQHIRYLASERAETSVTDLTYRCNYQKVFTVSFTVKEWHFFIIHRDTAAKPSKLFRDAAAALPEHWDTNESKDVELPSGNPIMFQIYSHWAYTGKVVIDDRPRFTDAPVARERKDQQVCVNAKSVLGLMITKLPVWTNCVNEAILNFIWTKMEDALLLKVFIMLWVLTNYSKLESARLAAGQHLSKEYFAEIASLTVDRVDPQAVSDVECQEKLRALLRDY
jgi:hypothetical protein